MKTEAYSFSNSDITVTYQPCNCVNAEKCAKQLSNVFRHSVIPWINLEGASTKKIIKQIKKCPSGALKFHYNKAQEVA
ncbi:MAG: (4Fe-4S)-binding protein [Bacteroidetes bacterium MedPE-SWsnd-G2]|nr:MAG: (4Fe-4S)-binding protein [Bacteroidetes bacterium MedPE-SWsnd-G2]